MLMLLLFTIGILPRRTTPYSLHDAVETLYLPYAAGLP